RNDARRRFLPGGSAPEGSPGDETETPLPGLGARRRRLGGRLGVRWERGPGGQPTARQHQCPSAALAAPGRRHASARIPGTDDLVDVAGALIAPVWAVRHGVETGASMECGGTLYTTLEPIRNPHLSSPATPPGSRCLSE